MRALNTTPFPPPIDRVRRFGGRVECTRGGEGAQIQRLIRLPRYDRPVAPSPPRVVGFYLHAQHGQDWAERGGDGSKCVLYQRPKQDAPRLDPGIARTPPPCLSLEDSHNTRKLNTKISGYLASEPFLEKIE